MQPFQVWLKIDTLPVSTMHLRTKTKVTVSEKIAKNLSKCTGIRVDCVPYMNFKNEARSSVGPRMPIDGLQKFNKSSIAYNIEAYIP